MKLSQIQLPEENPFAFIKVRQILLWFLLFTFTVGIWYGFTPPIISSFTKANVTIDSEPIIEYFFLILVIFLTAAWTWRQCKLVGINFKRLIGKIPKKFNWLAFIYLIVARFLFNRSLLRVSYYLISFFAYSWIDSKLRYSLSREEFLENLSKTFSPALYIFIYGLGNSLSLLLFIFIIYGIILHKWSFKWGQKRTILYFCLLAFFFGLIPDFLGFIGATIYASLDILIYLKTRSLIIVFIAALIDIITDYIFSYSIKWYDLSGVVVEQLRDRIWISFVLLAITTPFLIRFIYQNWHRINEPLPYYLNSSE